MPNPAPLQDIEPKKAFAPTPADDPILIALNDYYCLLPRHIQKLLYSEGSRKYAPFRLAKLDAGGYVFADDPAPPPSPARPRTSLQTSGLLREQGSCRAGVERWDAGPDRAAQHSACATFLIKRGEVRRGSA